MVAQNSLLGDSGITGGSLETDGIQTLGSLYRSRLAGEPLAHISKYGVEGVSPTLTTNFLNNEYLLGGVESTFADAFTGNSPKLTYSTAAGSNSTMVNSSGNIVWAPHNFVTYSEDFSQWSDHVGLTEVSSTTTDPLGGSTAYTYSGFSGATNNRLSQIFSLAVGVSSTLAIWLKGTAGETIELELDTANSPQNEITFTGDWQLETVSNSSPTVGRVRIIYRSGNTADVVSVWGAHVYRSDLGGMAPVPGAATGFATYVPTNGNAEYLPRVGHHVYNGSAWVNEGLLIESEPRTNLITESTPQSGDLDASGGSFSYVTCNFTPLSGPGIHFDTVGVSNTYTYFTPTYTAEDYTFSVFVEMDDGNAPAFGSSTGSDASNDFVLVVDAAIVNALSYNVEHFGGNTYRVSGQRLSASTTTRNTGVLKYSGNSTRTFKVTGYQFEAAPTPSSYMPTSGGTYTRTAQSLTVPAHWYDVDNPTYTGPELVTNGGFDTGISDWVGSTTGASTFVWNNGKAELFKASGETAAFYQLLTLTAGETYQLTWEDTGTGGNVRVGTSVNGQNIVAITSDKSITFTATAADNYLQFNCGTNNATAIIDNISVRQVSAPQFGWPELEYIGDELLSAFSDASWTTTTGEWTYDAANDEWDLAVSAAGSTAALNHDITVTEGSVYVVTATVSNITNVAANELFLRITNTEAGTVDLLKNDGSGDTVSNGGDGTYTFTFVAGASTPTFQIRAGGASDGDETATLVSASVREINPLAVSIQMDGRMTYADEGLASQSTFVNWVLDGSNEIRAALQTFGSDVGQINYIQDESGYTQVEIPSAIDAYSPGVLVPFNISSRHGSTFVNGAVDGVALTEDTTPTALPDLSGTNLQIAYDFMGTIGQFRQFAGDIGDAGLVTATKPSTEPTLSLTFDGTGGSFYTLSWSE